MSRRLGVFRLDRRARLRLFVAVAAAACLTSSVLTATPSDAVTIPLIASLGKPVPGHASTSHPATVTPTRAVPERIAKAPAAGTFSAKVPADSPLKTPATTTVKGARVARASGSWSDIGTSGIAVARATPAVGAPAADPVTSASVTIVTAKAAAKRHLHGVVLNVRRTDSGRAAAPVAVKIPQKLLTRLYGADYASRVRWVQVPVDSTAAPTLSTSSEAASTVDTKTGSVIVTPRIASRAVTLAAVSTPVSASGTGSFAATSLTPATSWDVSAQTGDFSWQYPMATPPAAAGPAPSVGLSYDSQSVDGETGSTNNQPSAVGEGWTATGGGFIERAYTSCAQDDGASGATTTSGDLCWKADNSTLSLDGHSGQLVKTSTAGVWKLSHDDGSRIEHLTGTGQGCAANGTYDTDCWRLTTTDGTQYYFGLNQLPGWATGNATTNSTWTVPVFGNDAGEPCHATTFAASSCTQAWRWNLDYVVDVHHNAEALYYNAETNRYAKNGTGSTSYVRGGQLNHIDYGLTSSTVYTANAATDKVTYGYNANGRCVTGCTAEAITAAATTPTTPANYPDVPFDQLCTSTTSCTGQTSPTFWTDGMLNTVTTSYRSSSTAYSNVDVWTLTHAFPDQGDGTNHALVLTQVKHTGYAGSASLTEPATTFTSVALQNRVWPDGYAPLDKFRISSITAPTGAVTSVNYSAQDCQASEVATIEAGAATNDRRCFPQYWTPQVTPPVEPKLDLFHKYVVTSVISNPKTGGPYDQTQETDYDYTGSPAWKYDTSPITVDKQRTWNVFAGFSSVRIRVGDHTTPALQQDTEYTFYQGLDGDRAGTSGGTKTVFVTGTSTVHDSAWLGGQTRDTKVLNGVGGTTVSDTITVPWASGVEATDGDLTARFVDDGTTIESEPLSTGGTRTSTTTTTHESTYGLPTSVDTVTPDGSTCATTEYAPANADAWIIGLPQEQASIGVSCGDTPTYPADAISDVRTSYDGHAYAAQPTLGDATATQTADSYSGTTGSTAHWATTAGATYDAMGRPLSSTDALGHVTKTAYTPATGGPLTKTVGTNTTPFSWTTTTNVTPDRGLETSTTDESGLLTTATYDALGRRTQVWLPGHSQASYPTNPSSAYAYTETATAPLAVATTTLMSNVNTTAYTLYDGLGQQIQTQTLSPQGGSIITDTQYDSQGRVARTNNAYWTTSVSPSTTQFVPTNQQQIASSSTPVYDGAGRTTATVLTSNANEVSRTSVSYKGADRVDTTPPAGGTPTTSITDALGRQSSLTQYLAATPDTSATTEKTTYGYDASGRMTSMTDPSGNAWTWQFDVLGHNTQAVDPDTGTTTSTYDTAGELLSSTDGRGQTLSYTYDALGRKTAEYNGSTSGALLKAWTYDTLAKGKPTSSSSYLGSVPGTPGSAYKSTINGYDAGGRPTGTTTAIPTTAKAFGGTSYTQTLSYFDNGQLANETDSAIGGLAAERLAFGWDGLGNETSVSGTSSYANVIYTGIAQMAQINRAGTVVDYSGYAYDNATGKVLGITDQTGTGSSAVVQEYRNYTRDASGNITSAKITGAAGAETQCYQYDHLQELTQAWTPATAACTTAPTSTTLGGPAKYWSSYTYDPATGNRLSATQHNTGTGSDKVSTYSYPAATSPNPHGVTSVSSIQGATTTNSAYAYDASGDTTTRPGQTLDYDVDGKLSKVTTSAGSQDNVYDSDGNLLLQTDPTNGSTLFLGDTELHEKAGSTTVTANRTYSIGSIPVDERSTDGGANKVLALNTDVDGTADLEFDVVAGKATRRYTDPFGNVRGSGVTWSSKHGFLNAPTSSFAGVTQLGARAYDATIGRFLSVDPILAPQNPLQNNGYAYAANSPIMNTDATGLCLTAGDGNADNCMGAHGAFETSSDRLKKVSHPKPPGNSYARRDIPNRYLGVSFMHPNGAYSTYSFGTYKNQTKAPAPNPFEILFQRQLDNLEEQSLNRSGAPDWLTDIARWQYAHRGGAEGTGGVILAGSAGRVAPEALGTSSEAGNVVVARVASTKFSDYIFKEGATHGKDKVFTSFGYSGADSESLASEFERQGSAAFQSGNYTLGKLDQYGQRLNIPITLNGQGAAGSKSATITSGWMVRPDGTITLNTPFSGFAKE